MFLYIGAGTDIRRALCVCNRKRMILVDCQPYSEYGKLLSGKTRLDGTDMYSRPKFPRHVANALRKHGFTKTASRTDDVWVCTREGGPELIYYMNTSVPEDLNVLKPALAEVDTLYVAGHWPHATILDALPKVPLYFWGAEGTSYSNARDEDYYTVVCALHADPAVRDRFTRFGLFARNGDKLEFSTWNEFCDAVTTAHAAKAGKFSLMRITTVFQN